MDTTTSHAIGVCTDPSLCPSHVQTEAQELLTALTGVTQASAGARAALVAAEGAEPSPSVRARLEELDQTLGAIEREARALTTQTRRVVGALRQLQEVAPRVLADIDTLEAR